MSEDLISYSYFSPIKVIKEAKVYLLSKLQHPVKYNQGHLESRRGQSASISSMKITEGFPDVVALCAASAKASRKIFSLSPACDL